MVAVETVFKWVEALMRARGVKRRRLEAEGHTLSYHEYGPREAERTIVLVHGLGTSTLSWFKVIRPLGRRYRVLALDLPGWGFSPYPPGRDHSTVPDLVAAITLFLERVAGRPVVLIGQSMGGWACAKAAASRPDLVEELVLVNNAGVLYPEVAELRTRLDLRSPAMVDEFWRNMYHRVPRLYRLFRKDFVRRMHEPRILRFMDSLTEADFINADLGRLTVPVTILWGQEDRFIPAHTVDLMVRELRQGRVVWIPRCGHIPALERPREFLRIVNGILA